MTSTSKSFEIAPGRRIGDGYPCFVVAEIGSNHNQDLDLARRLIDAAASAGVDAVKFQTFRASQHYSRRTPGFSYLNATDTFELIRSLELDRSWHEPLKAHAKANGVAFLSSACDLEAVDELHGLGMVAHKVASFDLTDLGLIRHMAATGRPLILSTGMADWMEIQRAVDACTAEGNDRIVLLQCTSLYPAPAELSNLRAMRSMRAAFSTLAGYSDHTEGDHVCLAAVALGACVVEKHFTLDRTLPGPDHPFAIEPAALREMMKRLRDVESALGDGAKAGPRPQEEEMFEKGRRSIHARCAIRAGERITAAMLVAKRPGLGIPPHLSSQVVGRVARQDIEEDQWITWDMI
jgi:sialic acid synthase SpsE